GYFKYDPFRRRIYKSSRSGTPSTLMTGQLDRNDQLLVSGAIVIEPGFTHNFDAIRYARTNSLKKRKSMAETVTTALQIIPGARLLKRRYRRPQVSPRSKATPASKGDQT